jgi:hypothetical protein
MSTSWDVGTAAGLTEAGADWRAWGPGRDACGYNT